MASFAVTETVDVVDPSAVTLDGDEVMVDWPVVAAPATKDTVAVLASAFPPSVADTVAVPADVPDVSVAVYVPSLLFVVVPTVPSDVAIATVPPEDVRAFE